jgi:hypothetical protein
MIAGCRYFEDKGNYKFGCPEGTWHGRLDHRCWGKSANLLLYFTNMDTQEKYWFSVYFNTDYTPRKGGPSFKTSVQEGDVFTLTTSVTAGGNPCLIAASPVTS